jgi:hypothetical protein
MSHCYYYQSEGGKLRLGVGFLLVILTVASLGLWWAIISMAISWLWK